MSRLTINSNIPSLNAQRNLGNASKSLETSFTRLSSGLRINKASDDAAGLSISESLKADTRIFNQGIRNLNDGLSLLSVADGALNELTNIVTRLSELAEQSANGTLGNKQRLSLDQEAQSLSKEYNRIARSTEFNGRKIFNYDFGQISLAGGGGEESLISSNLGGGIGDGSYLAVSSLLVTNNTNQIIFEDFNNDGIQDLFNAGSINSYVGIGNGDGTFINSPAINLAGFDVESLDSNSDGIRDLIIRNTSSVYSLLGNGDGTFRISSSVAILANAIDLDVNDYNNDGSIDYAVAYYTTSGNRIEVFLGNNSGNFKFNYGLGNAYFSGRVNGLSSADLNNDGLVDFIASTGVLNITLTAGGNSVLLNNGDGTFRNGFRSSSIGASAIETQIADFNNDGILDFLSTNYGFSSYIYLGNGDGNFRLRSGLSPILSYSKTADLNSDGFLDIVAVNDRSVDSSFSFFGRGDGTFSSGITLNLSSSSTDVSTSIDIADLNGDGALDIGVSLFTANNLNIFLGNSSSGVSALEGFSLKTIHESRIAMQYFKDKLNRLSNQRGEIGAFQSRVDTGVSNLQQGSLAYSEANSRITDIDVAEESSRLTATKILQQSAAGVLAQANQQPRLVLRLLEDL